ncbi:MAG TPA: flagellar hook basal-body protein [Steroidobacteraceae bacterium]|nr:flagellar hook basal-body protein [Steroidobacteraceae bacterium]
MSDIFQIAGVGMQEGKQRLEAISLNAASASLPGYRRHVVAGGTFDTMLAATSTATAASTPTAVPHLVDLKPGATIATGRALDLAIEGDDLFFALTDGVQTWLTRGGSFHVNEAGELLGEGGLRVVGQGGEVRLPGSDVEVGPDGHITQQGVIVGAVQLFRANDPSSLQAAQGALLLAPEGVQPAEAGAGRVRSGALEASNTDSASEMLGLVALSRQFEALSHVLQGYDQMLGRAIEKLGEG